MSMPHVEKNWMLDILIFIEETLKQHWLENEGFINLQERLLAVRMILEEFIDDAKNPGKWHELLQICARLYIITYGLVERKKFGQRSRDWDLDVKHRPAQSLRGLNFLRCRTGP